MTKPMSEGRTTVYWDQNTEETLMAETYCYDGSKGGFIGHGETLLWWLIEQVRQKVGAAQAAAPAGDGAVPAPLPSGMAAPPQVVAITINTGADLTAFVARYNLNPSRVFHLVFPNCHNATVMLGGVMHQAKHQPVAALSPYTFFGGSYATIANHIDELLAQVPGHTKEKDLFGAMLKALKGKATTLGTHASFQRGLSAIGTMAGSEGCRCFGMLAGAIMALDLMKHGDSDCDTMFRLGGWPAVGNGTESLLREIDGASYQRAQHNVVALSPAAQVIFVRFEILLCSFVTQALERNKKTSRQNKQGSVILIKAKQERGINSDHALEAAAKNLLQRKVLAHL
jgi:hypothetical protein